MNRFLSAVLFFIVGLLCYGNCLASPIVLYAVGDIMPGGHTVDFTSRYGHGYPYERLSPMLLGGDMVVGNLEVPLLGASGRPVEKQFVFKAVPETAHALKSAGFTHLSLANNHMMDYGEEGLVSTIKALSSAGLEFAGAGQDLAAARRPSFYRVKDRVVAFLAYSNTFPESFYAGEKKAGTAPGMAAYIRHDIKECKDRADFVVVSFHWGAELKKEPKSYQTTLARVAVDSGADVVLGHHPHILQGVELYKGGVILYSLGNFSFSAYSRYAKRSIVAEVILDDSAGPRLYIHPINVDNMKMNFRPELLSTEESESVVEELSLLSRPFGADIVSEGKKWSVVPSGLSAER